MLGRVRLWELQCSGVRELDSSRGRCIPLLFWVSVENARVLAFLFRFFGVGFRGGANDGLLVLSPSGA